MNLPPSFSLSLPYLGPERLPLLSLVTAPAFSEYFLSFFLLFFIGLLQKHLPGMPWPIFFFPLKQKEQCVFFFHVVLFFFPTLSPPSHGVAIPDFDHLEGKWQQWKKNWKAVIHFIRWHGLIYSKLKTGKRNTSSWPVSYLKSCLQPNNWRKVWRQYIRMLANILDIANSNYITTHHG